MKYPFPYQDEYPHLAKEFDLYQEKHHKLLSNPVIQEFLKKDEHLHLFAKAICFPTKENQDTLNQLFKQFYSEIRLIKYISKLLHNNSVNYDKKQRKNKERCALILDQSASYNDDDQTTLVNLIPSETAAIVSMLMENSPHLEECIDHPKLYQALKMLTPNQKKIIDLAYVRELKDTEIAKLLGVSQQSVSKTHKKALIRISNYLEGRCFDGSVK